MTSCVRNICAKNYQNLITLLRVTIENVGNVFYETQCSIPVTAGSYHTVRAAAAAVCKSSVSLQLKSRKSRCWRILQINKEVNSTRQSCNTPAISPFNEASTICNTNPHAKRASASYILIHVWGWDDTPLCLSLQCTDKGTVSYTHLTLPTILRV